MIPWFFNQSEIRGFRDLPQRKQEARRMEQDRIVNEQNGLLRSRISTAKKHATRASKFHDKGLESESREELNLFKANLVACQPILNSYVKSSMTKQILDLMSHEGFEFPDLLIELRKDIDFGLFSVNIPEHLEELLKAEINPFEELGIEI